MSVTSCCFQGLLSRTVPNDVAASVKRKQMLAHNRNASLNSLNDSLCDPDDYNDFKPNQAKNDDDTRKPNNPSNMLEDSESSATIGHRLKSSLRLIGSSLSDLGRSMSRISLATDQSKVVKETVSDGAKKKDKGRRDWSKCNCASQNK